MKRINKYISLTLLLITVALAVGCNKVQIETDSDGKHLMDFSVASVDSKALVDDVTDIDAFNVYGYYTYDGSTIEKPFDNVSVSRLDGYMNETEAARYWEYDAKYSFAAFYNPSQASIMIEDFGLDSDGKFAPFSFTYEKKDFYDDFMLAVRSITTEEAASTDYKVPLVFQHILSNIHFNIDFNSVQNGTYIRIKSVSLSGMKRSAKFTYNQGWTNHSTAALQLSQSGLDLIIYKNGGKVYQNGEILAGGILSPTGTEGITVIPVDLSNYNNVVTLRLQCDISTDAQTWTQKSIEKTLNAGVIQEWEPGCVYTYTANLSVDYSINFSEPSVKDWIDEQATGSVIIK